MLLLYSSSLIFLLMFLSLFFFLPFSFTLLLRFSAWSLYLSILFLCVRLRACAFLFVCVRGRERGCVCVHVCILVGVGDKAVLQHHCVYKAVVCCLLLLITAQHNVSAQLAMHKIRCVCVCVCVFARTCERRTQKGLSAEWVKSRKNEKWNFIWKSICFSLTAVEHPFPIRKFFPKRGVEGNWIPLTSGGSSNSFDYQ